MIGGNVDRCPCDELRSDVGFGKFARVQARSRAANGGLAGSRIFVTVCGGAEAPRLQVLQLHRRGVKANICRVAVPLAPSTPKVAAAPGDDKNVCNSCFEKGRKCLCR